MDDVTGQMEALSVTPLQVDDKVVKSGGIGAGEKGTVTAIFGGGKCIVTPDKDKGKAWPKQKCSNYIPINAFGEDKDLASFTVATCVADPTCFECDDKETWNNFKKFLNDSSWKEGIEESIASSLNDAWEEFKGHDKEIEAEEDEGGAAAAPPAHIIDLKIEAEDE